MKLSKWLKPLETAGLKCNIWIEEPKLDGTYDEYCAYAGSMYGIPYWLVDYEIAPNDENGEAISWCHRIRKTIDDENGTEGINGFVITLKEKE